MTLDLSLVIPAFNEEQRIVNSLQKAISYLDDNNYNYEIIIVDDGSSDGTIQAAETVQNDRLHVMAQGQNYGKGAAVRRGMLASKGEYRIFSDADFSTPIYELPKVLDYLKNGTDVCIGSRALNPEMIKEHQPFYREFMGKTFNKIVQLLVLPGIKDTQCGFKGFRAEAADSIFSRAKIDRFSFDVEILYLAREAGYSIEEIPVEWYNDERSTVSPVKDSIQIFFDLLKIKKLHSK